MTEKNDKGQGERLLCEVKSAGREVGWNKNNTERWVWWWRNIICSLKLKKVILNSSGTWMGVITMSEMWQGYFFQNLVWQRNGMGVKIPSSTLCHQTAQQTQESSLQSKGNVIIPLERDNVSLGYWQKKKENTWILENVNSAWKMKGFIIFMNIINRKPAKKNHQFFKDFFQVKSTRKELVYTVPPLKAAGYSLNWKVFAL